MKHMELSYKYLKKGTKEIKGKKANPDILDFFDTCGHSWVDTDETHWCSAFVSAMFEKAGIRSTRALNARSYENWGIEVSNKDINIDDAKPGDVVVLWREDPKSWKGHVAFYVSHTKTHIKILGGNQRNEVNISTYPRNRIVTIRRAGDIENNVRMPLIVIQQKLKDLGYNPGVIDGLMGPNTTGAILSFKNDNGLKLTPIINKEFETKLENPLTKKREIPESRKNGKPKKSRIINNSNKTMALGGLGGLLTLGSQLTDALNRATDKVEEVQGIVKGTVNNIQNQASDTVADLKTQVDDIQEQASDKLVEIKDKADEVVDNTTDAIKDNVGEVVEAVNKFNWLMSNLDTILFIATIATFGLVIGISWFTRRYRVEDHQTLKSL